MIAEKHTHYSEVLLPDREPFTNYDSAEEHVLGKFSLTNLFIGSNNSGKSRLLRNLFYETEFAYTTNKYNSETFRNFLKEKMSDFNHLFSGNIVTIGGIKKDAIESLLNEKSRFISPTEPIYKKILKLLTDMQMVKGGLEFSGGVISSHINQSEIFKNMKNFGFKLLKEFQERFPAFDINSAKRFYIPMLRGMRPLPGQEMNGYKERTEQDYFRSKESTGSERKLSVSQVVFTGLELYRALKEKLLGEPEEREAVKKYENFLSDNFFNSKTVILIPKERDDTVHVKIGSERQLPIYNLGDGLQNLIIITFNMFMETRSSLFFIEEPDLCMHPGFQRTFLEVMTRLDRHQYFITTHSNHLLDMTLDFSNISVFLFRKTEEREQIKFKVSLVSSEDRNILWELGARNSSVFLTNATIWVEGITDRLYLRIYMQKYKEEMSKSDPETFGKLIRMKEDLHYSFVEYQGSNLCHWSFDTEDEKVKRISANYLCGNPFVIADGDIANKGDTIETYKRMIGDRFEVLKCKEMENLIPQEVLRYIVKDKFEKHHMSVDRIDYDSYSQSMNGLGCYLNSILSLREGESAFATESGTIKNKIEFCQKATSLMNDPGFEWSLTSPLRELCEKIFEHILKSNAVFSF